MKAQQVKTSMACGAILKASHWQCSRGWGAGLEQQSSTDRDQVQGGGRQYRKSQSTLPISIIPPRHVIPSFKAEVKFV